MPIERIGQYSTLSLVEMLVDAPQLLEQGLLENSLLLGQPCSIGIGRKTPDSIGLNICIESLAVLDRSEPSGMTLTKHILLRSGIGAHLHDSTCGFSVEYWLEGAAPPGENQFLCVSWTFATPSGENAGLSIRALSSVGGVSKELYWADKTLRFAAATNEGGLHGLRLVDGIEGFTSDLRFSKPLDEIRVLSGSGRHTIYFLMRARRVFGDEKASTLFISIV